MKKKADLLSGKYSRKVNSVKDFTPEQFDKVAQTAGTFKVILKAGEAIVVPPGYLVLVVAPEDVHFVRWGMLRTDVADIGTVC